MSDVAPTVRRTTPQPLAWVICDAIHLEMSSAKPYLLGVFSTIECPAFPAIHPNFACYLSLTECSIGPHRFEIFFGLNPLSLRPLLSRWFQSAGHDDLVHIFEQIPNLRLDGPGNYCMQIKVDDDVILCTNLLVRQRTVPGSQRPVSSPENV